MEVETPQFSLLRWVFSSLGVPYIVLFGLAGLVCLVLTLVLVIRGKGPMAAVALVLVVHVPFFIGLFAALQGAASSFLVIATSGATPKPSEVAVGTSTGLIAPMVGLLVMAPSYVIAILGALSRSFGSKPQPN